MHFRSSQVGKREDPALNSGQNSQHFREQARCPKHSNRSSR